jgi:hypothetical protein
MPSTTRCANRLAALALVASRFVGNFDGRNFRLSFDYPYSILLRHQAAFLS